MFDDAVAPVDVLRPSIADVATIGHDGKVLVVGTAPDGILYYTVRQSGFEDNALTDTVEQILPGFENWRVVPLTLATDDPSVRAYESTSLVDGENRPIMRSIYGREAERSAVGRVKLVSALGHLYLFRVSPEGKLLLNRFVLDGMTNELVPKIEVRYRRSQQKLVPDGGSSGNGSATTQDSLGFRDLEQNMFFEPTIELSFLGAFDVAKPWFSVELLPTAEHDRHRWNFFVHTDDELKLVSAAASAEGLVDPTDQSKVQQDPDKVDAKLVRTVPGIVERRLRLDGKPMAPFDSTLYHNQVERLTKAGPQLLKENTRVMLSVPITQDGRAEPTIAAVSFAVNNLGQLAQIGRVADRDELLKGDTKEVLLPIDSLEEIKLVADTSPPPEGAITGLSQSPNEQVSVSTDVTLDGKLRSGQQVKVSGTRSYDGVYVASAVEDGTFEINAVFGDDEADQGHWEVIDDGKGLVFENMVASYERTDTGGLRITCLSHNVEPGDEIRITGSIDHDGTYPITDVGDDNSFELDQVWPEGEVVNLSRRPRRGLSFDGKGDYLEAGPIQSPPQFSDARLERSISAWVNLTDITGETQTIFATRSDLIHLYVDRNGKLTLEVGFADGHKAKVVDTEALPERAWVHVTAMLDYQGETTGETTLTLCVGGQERASVTVEPRKPLHLPVRNLRLDEEALPISTLQYDMTMPSGAVTMEAWVSTRRAGRQVIASWYHGAQFVLAIDGDKNSRVAQFSTAANSLKGRTHLPDSDWHHIAATYDPARNLMELYVNGQFDTSKEAGPGADEVDAQQASAALEVAEGTKQPLWLGYLGASAAEAKATGRDVVTVRHADGAYRKIGLKHWQAVDGRGRISGPRLRETHRDDWSVYLKPEEDGPSMQLDLHRRKISRNETNVRSNAGTIESLHGVSGLNASRVDFAGGSWRELDANRWGKFDRFGNMTSQTTGPFNTSSEILVVERRATELRLVRVVQPVNMGIIRIPGIRNEIVLDLARRRYTEQPVPILTSITGAEAVGDTSAGVDGRTVDRIESSLGQFVMTGTGAWELRSSSGGGRTVRYQEINRREGQVVLDTDDHRLIFEVASNRIVRIDNRKKVDFLDITSSSAPYEEASENERFDGFLADVRLWNRARTAGAIKRTWQERLTGTERALIAHWPLEQTSSTQLADATKSKAHVAVPSEADLAWYVEPHRAPGDRSHYEGEAFDEALTIGAKLDRRDRYALELDGEIGHLTVPTLSEDLSDGFTVAAWARWDSFNHWSRIVDFGNGPDEDNIFLANRNTTNELVFNVRGGGELSVANALTPGRWVHVAATVSVDGSAVLYIDGEAAASGTFTPTPATRRASNYIGRSNWDHDGYFHGGLRDVQLWGMGLPAHEIKYYMNTPAKGIEDGLLHHWPMRAATIKSRRRIVDQGTGAAKHADLADGAVSERLSSDLPPTPLTEYRGKLSDVQVWTVNRPIDTIRETMHDQLTGNEYGLAGYWRCGGLIEDRSAPGTQQKVTPDFAVDGHDARVVGDTFVSASDLPRLNSVGRAVKYTNDDLVAVTQGARYRETFEFRAVDFDGEVWTQAQVENADGRGDRIFEMSYWGRKTRTSRDKIVFKADEPHRIIPVGNGWYRAESDFTVPDQVAMVRAFEVDEVTGRWTTEQDPPEGEWMELNIRKHRMELISDSVSRRTYTDVLELPTLADNASELAVTIRQIPTKERQIASKRADLERVLEELLIFVNRAKFQAEHTELTTSSAALVDEVAGLDRQIGAYAGDELNYRYMVTSRESGKVLDWSGRVNAHLWDVHAGENQAWEFQQTSTSGQYHIVCVKGRGRLTITKNGDSVYLSNGDGNHHRWTIVDLGGEYRGFRNVATGSLLDVYAHAKGNGSLITTWGRTGRANQSWSLRGWFPGQAEARRLDARRADALNRSRHVVRVPVYSGILWWREISGYRDANAPQRALARVEAEMYDNAARAIRAKYPTGRQKKSTYDAELGTLTSRRDDRKTRLAKNQDRLAWLTSALADTTPEREQALIQLRDRLETEIRTLQDEINRLNTEYIAAAKEIQGEPQTMALVAEDPLGLKTYGAVLGFAAPITGLSSTATAEGNVQLSYFDTDGRMRSTDYDATSDSVNATYEQWVPTSIAVCPDLSRDDAVIRLDGDSPIAINPLANTIEAWFYYPMPFQADGTPYPVNVLTSSGDDSEAAIAIGDNRRLGALVDGFFHDAGVDLSAMLDAGWHHVAARTDLGVTTFFLNGEPVGHDADTKREIARYATTFPGGVAGGTEPHIGLGALEHNYDSGFSVQTWVRWDAFDHWSRIIDFGVGSNNDNIILGNQNTSNTLSFNIRRGSGQEKILTVPNVLETGTWYNVAVSVSGGIGVVYIDGEERARGEMDNPASVRRARCYVGLSNWWDVSGTSDRPFNGALSDLHIWNRGLTSEEVRGFMYEPPKGTESGLLHHLTMGTVEVGNDAELRIENRVTDAIKPIPYGCSSELLPTTASKPIATLGNRPDGGAPAGKLAEVRVWSRALTDEVIKVNSMIHLTGNEPELEALYPLDDIIGSEAEARDHTGNHQPAALEAANPIARTARIGNRGSKATEFGGADSRIQISQADFTRSYTVEFLAKRTANDRSDLFVLSAANRPDLGLYLGFDAGNRLTAGHWLDPVSVDAGDRGVNEWVHVALVYDQPAKTATLYLDGQQASRRAGIERPGVEPEPDGAVLKAHQQLKVGDFRRSANGRHTLIQEESGSFVLKTRGAGQRWSSGKDGHADSITVLQGDGHLVTYSGGVAIWASRTAGTGDTNRLVVQNDGNVVLKKGNSVLWQTNTAVEAPGADFKGQLAELRVWDHARSAEQIQLGHARRASDGLRGMVARVGFDEPMTDGAASGQAAVSGWVRQVGNDDLPLAPGPGVVTAEYSTVGVDPLDPTRQRAVLRRFFGFATDRGEVALLPGKPIEELLMKWIGNAQFEPTLLGYMEGAPPVPSENLTINYDYDGATSVELIQSEETVYSWNRNRDIGGGLDANFFLGAGWSLSGGAFIESQISEGHLGARGSVNTQWRRNENSTIRLSSTDEYRDRLDLRGTYETDPKFPHLGNRFVPKNVGYALVVSGMADVFITQMRRTGRMVAYEVLPVEDVPPDINTITFMINPAYTLNGSLDGLVGSHAADERFFRHVPEMRAQYGSRYPASYFNLEQAYDLKSQIDRWDKDRESYFVNFDARETGLSDKLLDEVPDSSEADSFGQIEVDDGTGDEGEESETSDAEARDDLKAAYESRSEGGKDAAKKRREEIEKRFSDQDKQMEANTAFMAWQRKMEGLSIRAAKRNIVNTYVWDADGGMRFEEQSFANTIEHTIGGSFSLNASLGLDANVTVAGFKFELQAMGTFEMSQTMSKTASSTTSFDLNVRLDGVEQKGVTDPEDYPINPGEKVDRYRFMSFYLEGDVDHFNDFFNYVVDPEWLMSNDEEARALRQVARGRPNKAWRVMHRVTYVERPALMGFGRDLRTADDLEEATREVFNYFDALEQSTDELQADIGQLKSQMASITRMLGEIKEAQENSPAALPSGSSGGGGQVIDIRDPGGEGPASNGGPEAAALAMLNQATLADLVALPGIGDSMGQAILDLRNSLGGFTSLSQLTQVSGIGQAKLDALRPLLTTG